MAETKQNLNIETATRRLDAEIERVMRKLAMLLQQREAMRHPVSAAEGPLKLINTGRSKT